MREKQHPRFDPSLFKDITPEFRSIPFWSLNDNLEPAEIRRQLVAFKEGGFGGAYLHSRIGLLTPYLGDDWWRAMDAGVDACDELGIEAWFYDEDKWPSGFAGGIVPRLSEAYRARALVRLKKGSALPANCEALCEDERWVYLCWTAPMGEAWFNGTCWVDLYSPDAVKAFIDCSYRPYVERYKGRPSVRGIFTDEPQISPRAIPFAHEGVVTWSPFLRERFRKDHGRDVLAKAAELFDETGDFRQTRLAFYRSVAGQFEAAFTIPIATYCGENGFVWTGHYNGENSFRSVIGNVGNMARHYKHMQRPGVDWLGNGIERGLLTCKTLSSVANQHGQPRRLSELFGCSGQDMSAEDRAWIFGWHAVLGVNHACPHLSLYTVRGVRKRDYPPTLSPQQPWWPFHRPLEDMMARLSYAVTAGSFDAEMLVLLPVESGMCEYPAKSMDERSGAFESLMNRLMASHRDFDLGEESILAESGRVEKGRLVVGESSYPFVLLPDLLSIRKSTLDLLEKFIDQGGVVASCGKLPELVDGVPSDLAKAKLAARLLKVDGANLGAELEKVRPAHARLEAVDGKGRPAMVWCQHRKSANGRLCILFNPSRLETVAGNVLWNSRPKSVRVWDVKEGGSKAAQANPDGGVRFTLAPAESLVFSLDMDGISAEPGEQRSTVAESTVALAGPSAWKRLDANALVLDDAMWEMEGKGASDKPEPVIAIQERLTRAQHSGPLELCFETEVHALPERCLLAFECPNMDGEWRVNGKAVPLGGGDFFLDTCYATVEVGTLLKVGRNEIRFKTDYVAPVPASVDPIERYGTELETCFLVGDFAVGAEKSPEPVGPNQLEARGCFRPKTVHRLRNLSLEAEEATSGTDLSRSGYPFYAGRFQTTLSFNASGDASGRWVLVFDAPACQAIVAVVNGVDAGQAILSPWEIDITKAVKPGENLVELTLVNSLRNLLGPHHHKDGELAMVGPESFGGRTTWTGGGPGDDDWIEKRKTGEAKIWRDDYHVIAFGLGGGVRLVRK